MGPTRGDHHLRGVPSGQQILGLHLSDTVAFEPSLSAKSPLALR